MTLKKRIQRDLGGEVGYRTLKLRRWRAQVDQMELPFTHPTKFMDVFENFSHNVHPTHESGPNIGELIQRDNPHNMFVSCWTMSDNSSAMWQLYGKVGDCKPVTEQDADVCVQVRVPIDRLIARLRTSEAVGDAELFAGRVRYVTDEDLTQGAANRAAQLGRAIVRDRDLHMVKRKDFEWEQEIRLLLDPEQPNIDRTSHPTLFLRWQDVVTGIVLDPRLRNEHAVRGEFEDMGFDCPIRKSLLCQRTMLTVPVQGF